MTCTFQFTPTTPDAVVAHRPDGARDVRAVAVVVERVVVLLTKFQPTRSSTYVGRRPWEMPSAQPPRPCRAAGILRIGARMSPPSIRPLPLMSVILPAPWLSASFRSQKVMRPSPSMSQVRAAGGGDFALVDPDVLVEVGVGVVDAGVDVGDRHACRAGRDVPGGRGIDAVLAVQPPHRVIGEERVVGHRIDVDRTLGLHVADPLVTRQGGGEPVQGVGVARRSHQAGDLGGLQRDIAPVAGEGGGLDPRQELDQQRIRDPQGHQGATFQGVEAREPGRTSSVSVPTPFSRWSSSWCRSSLG